MPIVHDDLPPIPAGYVRQSIILDGVVPYVRADIVIGRDTLTDWYMFDTGYSGLLRINAAAGRRHRLDERARRAFNPFKKTFLLPAFRLGGHTVTDLKGGVHDIGRDDRTGGPLGNALLERFNVILDNRNGDIYLRRNLMN